MFEQHFKKVTDYKREFINIFLGSCILFLKNTLNKKLFFSLLKNKHNFKSGKKKINKKKTILQ